MSDVISPQALSELIGSIYDCALDPEHWDQTLCEVRDAFCAQTAQLGLMDRSRGRILIEKNVGMEPAVLDFQARLASEVNARLAEYYRETPLDEPNVFSRHLTPEVWETSPFVRYFRSFGFIDSISYVLIWEPGHFSGFGIGRLARQGIITDREISLGGLLLPHLRRAVTISKVLDAQAIEQARMAETLDALKCGVVLTNGAGAILHANRAAERMFRLGRLAPNARGVLSAKLPAAAKELHNALRLAALDESAIGKTGLAIRLNEDEAPPHFAHVLPLTGSELRTRLAPEAAAAVFIGAAQDEAETAEAMAAAFGLTGAETRLLESLLAGNTLAETAKASGVAVVTAKTHLDNIFGKTGVNRQADLIRLAERVAPPAGSP
jgi:DNA-binding CsgD family transcriptional regulator/PAS domain-containing protein